MKKCICITRPYDDSHNFSIGRVYEYFSDDDKLGNTYFILIKKEHFSPVDGDDFFRCFKILSKPEQNN